MPIYEYVCRRCGSLFEKLMPFGASSADLSCPTCGQPGPKRVVSTIARTAVGGA